MTQSTPAPQIRHEADAQRFATVVDGVEAHVAYRCGEGLLTITHTLVPAQIGGRGIAGELVRAALDFARGAGMKVSPACSYADAWMRRHPDYDDLRA